MAAGNSFFGTHARRACLSAFAIVAVASSWAFADVSTPPMGVINLTIAAGTGTTSQLSTISFPLLSTPSITGQTSGMITGVTTNTISNSNAGWQTGALSKAATPYVIQITSGSAAGYSLLISTVTANTATTVTLDAEESSQIDLTKLGIATGTAGDTYSIFECDTLLSAFGQGSAVASSTAALGAASSTSADVIQMMVSGAWRQYYYNTASGHWARVGPNINSDNVPIRPDAGISYMRRAAVPLTLSVTGQVPTVNRKAFIANQGLTDLSSFWPMDVTLGTSNIASIPGWVSGSSSTGADIVQLMVLGAWRQYYYNGSHWARVGPGIISDNVNIPVGSSVLLLKKGSSSGFSIFIQPIPYNL